VFSSTAISDKNRETVEFYYLSRVRAIAARAAIVEEYNRGAEKFTRITPRSFSDDYTPLDAKRMKEALEAVGIDPDLLWFIRYATIVGAPVSLPIGRGTPTASGVLENIDAVEAPTHVKRDFVAFMGCPFNKDAF
jgi:hypothetical protein